MSSTVVERTPRKAQLNEGVYDAKITKVEAADNVQTAFGLKDVIYVIFDVDGIELRKKYNKSWNPNSALYGLVTTLRPKEELTTKYDVAQLVGDNCRILVGHNETDGGDVWENVEKVAKPKPTLEDDAANKDLL